MDQPQYWRSATFRELNNTPGGLEIAQAYNDKCRLFYDDGKTIFVHGGLCSEYFMTEEFQALSLDDQMKDDDAIHMIWTRAHHLTHDIAEDIGRNVIVGHDPYWDSLAVKVDGRLARVDTGCGYSGGYLSAYHSDTDVVLTTSGPGISPG